MNDPRIINPDSHLTEWLMWCVKTFKTTLSLTEAHSEVAGSNLFRDFAPVVADLLAIERIYEEAARQNPFFDFKEMPREIEKRFRNS